MNIQHFHGVPPLYTNTFLIITNAKHGIIIDAAAEPETYLKALDEAGATLTHILQTHGHFDHVGAVASLKKATGCKVYMDKIDAEGSQLLPLTPDVITDEWPANGELVIDELPFKIYRTPGHTKGGVCLSCYGLLFSGDTLFAGSCGRTDFAGGSMQEMQKSLSLLAELPLPDATTVLPGHGESSTLGQERSTNPYMNGAWYYCRSFYAAPQRAMKPNTPRGCFSPVLKKPTPYRWRTILCWRRAISAQTRFCCVITAKCSGVPSCAHRGQTRSTRYANYCTVCSARPPVPRRPGA